MLRRLYDQTMALAMTPYATWALVAVAFAESSFFPIPPDVVLIPMILAARDRAFHYVAIATIASVVGGLAGYGIGWGLWEVVGAPILDFYGAMGKFEEFRAGYNEHGALIVFIAGLTPFPYKVITIASGAFGLDLMSFMVASVLARGGRFLIVGLLLWRFGEPIRTFIERYLGVLTVVFCILLVGGFVVLKYAV
ncbi:MAG: DedA family protein [Alphaproteobacteria bacterium]|nr:DedA family protein [Alphaproteobacteria bacterium]MCB9930623.1 DedA family protein [Alphaproteobacteria bacterium]